VYFLKRHYTHRKRLLPLPATGDAKLVPKMANRAAAHTMTAASTRLLPTANTSISARGLRGRFDRTCPDLEDITTLDLFQCGKGYGDTVNPQLYNENNGNLFSDSIRKSAVNIH
jgi:hypothetical protein